MATQKIARIGGTIVLGAIVAGFILPSILDVFYKASMQKQIASIDDKSIQEVHFFETLQDTIHRIQYMYPKLSFKEIVQMGYPQEVLRYFVQKQVSRKEMEDQGFVITDNIIRNYLKQYPKQLLDDENKMRRRILLEDSKTSAFLSQLVMPYTFPDEYSKLLYKASNIKREFDLIELPYKKITVTKEPTQQDLDNLEKTKHSDERLIDRERKSFMFIDFDQERIKVKDQEVQEYFIQNKDRYNVSQKRDVVELRLLNEDPTALEGKTLDMVIDEKIAEVVEEYTASKVDLAARGFNNEDITSVFETEKKHFSRPTETKHMFYVQDIHEAQFDDVRDMVLRDLKLNKLHTIVAEAKKHLDEEQALEKFADKYNFALLTFQNIDGAGVDENGQQITLPFLPKVLEGLKKLDEDEHSIIPFNDNEHYGVIKVQKVIAAKRLEGEALKQVLKAMWVEEEQKKGVESIVKDVYEDQAKLKDYIQKYKLIRQSNLIISANESPPHSSMTQDFIGRIMNAEQNGMAIGYSQNGVLIAIITNDQVSSFDEKKFEEQKQAYLDNASESVRMLWLARAFQKHKVKMNVEHLLERLQQNR